MIARTIEAGATVFGGRGLRQQFGKTSVLRGVDFEVASGEVHALLGANGAGKSTLVRILGGFEAPAGGSLHLDGRVTVLNSPRDAERSGVVTVTQELSLFPELNVLENLFAGREPKRLGLPARSLMRAEGLQALARLGLRVPLTMPVGNLGLADRQLLEIAKVLTCRPRVLLVDEPTSALNAADTRRVLDVLRDLADSGVAVLYISHFLDDVMSISDTVTVLREGRAEMSRVPAEGTSIAQIVTAMVGRTPEPRGRAPLPPASTPPGSTQPLTLRAFAVRGKVSPLDLTAEPGEVVGVTGIEGSGATTVLRALFGLVKHTGSVAMPSGRQLRHGSRAAVRAGAAYVPADRKRLGLLLDWSIEDNIALARTSQSRWLVSPGLVRARAADQIARLGIVARDGAQCIRHLSGGNQQRIVFAKWLETDPSLLLLEDPTRGVDLAARAEMHTLIRQIAATGAVVLAYSSDPQELADLCDRVLVFYRGAVVAELSGDTLDVPTLTTAVTSGSVAEGGAREHTSRTSRRDYP